MRSRLIFVAVLAVGAIVLLSPISAVAAMDATLSSTHARPGDSVLFLTDDHSGRGRYGGLSAEDQQPIYLIPRTSEFNATACDGPSSWMIGKLQWRANAAGLAFVVPQLPLADYWLFMKTQGQCWRVGGQTGGSHGPLILTVGTTPADNQDVARRWTVDSLATPKPLAEHSSPGRTWLGIAGVLLLVAIVFVASRFRQR
jgi:hypothetical protein